MSEEKKPTPVLEKRFNKLLKSHKYPLPEKNIKYMKKKSTGEIKIRCQGTTSSGNQCYQEANKNSLYCNIHRKVRNAKRSVKLVKQKTQHVLGIYGKKTKTFLDKELKEVSAMTPEELVDVTRDISVLTAIVKKLMGQTPRDEYVTTRKGGKSVRKLVRSKEENAIRMAKSLQYAIMNLSVVKKMFFDVKYSDANTIPIDMFKYVMNRMRQIIIEEVKDVQVIDKIQHRINELGLEYQKMKAER